MRKFDGQKTRVHRYYHSTGHPKPTAQHMAFVNSMTNWQNHQWMKAGMRHEQVKFFANLAYGSGRR